MKLPVVLNTRAREQAAELSRLLEAAGFVAVEAPAIAIASVWDASVKPSGYDWVVLASANAGRGLDLSGAHVVCGAASAAALGITPDIAIERFSAAAALDRLRPLLVAGARVLVPRAEEGREELVDGLRALGALVDDPIAYRTVAVPNAAARLARGDVDVITLCSPSAARSIASSVSREYVVCLGETTAAAARELGIPVHAVATQTSMQALVDAVRGVYGGVTV